MQDIRLEMIRRLIGSAPRYGISIFWLAPLYFFNVLFVRNEQLNCMVMPNGADKVMYNVHREPYTG